MCNGQLMSIDQNPTLFQLIGTTYGGDGQTTFALPDLRGRLPVHVGPGFAIGQAGWIRDGDPHQQPGAQPYALIRVLDK